MELSFCHQIIIHWYPNCSVAVRDDSVFHSNRDAAPAHPDDACLDAKIFFFSPIFRGEITQSSIWDKLVFKKVQALLGGRIKFMVVASAPLSAEVLNFARCALGCYVSASDNLPAQAVSQKKAVTDFGLVESCKDVHSCQEKFIVCSWYGMYYI